MQTSIASPYFVLSKRKRRPFKNKDLISNKYKKARETLKLFQLKVKTRKGGPPPNYHSTVFWKKPSKHNRRNERCDVKKALF